MNNKKQKPNNITAQDIHNMLAAAKNDEEITQVCDVIMQKLVSMLD
jgi:hypothetical protein